MKRTSLSLPALVAGVLLVSPALLRADKGHDHAKPGHSHDGRNPPGHGHDHGRHDHSHADTGAVMGSHDGMASLYKHLGEMETELADGKLEGIHGHDEAIRAAVRGLDRDTTLTAEKRKRVQGYVKNVVRLSGRLHSAADGNKLDQAKKDIVKLKAQVDLLDKQFGHSHKPGAAHPAHGGNTHAHPGK